MKLLKSAGLTFLLLICSGSIKAQNKAALSNPNASKEARALYAYINDIFGKKMFSGQIGFQLGHR